MSNSGFGDYDPEKAGQKFSRAKINKVAADQSNVFRVLPPFGSLREKNRLSHYWGLHYGFAKSKTGKSIPIACIAEYKTENKKRTVVKNCPLCDKINAMQNALEALKVRPDGQAAALALTKQLEGMLNYGKPTSNHHYLNVLTRDGSPEILRIGHKHMVALENELKRIKTTLGVNAASVSSGLYLDFRRSGKGADAVQTVTTFQITDRDPNTGALTPRYVESNLTAQDAERIMKDVKELTELYRIFSTEDLALIAKGDEETVKRLFAAPTSTEEAEDTEVADNDTVNGLVADAMVNYMEQGKAPSVSSAPTPAPAPAAILAVSAPLPQASPPTPTVSTTAAASSPLTVPIGNLSVDEIIARFSKGGQPG